ncbi:DUF6392 family protein [Vibrio maritimus]|uniref:DUF6392 family protein n=1 Tax=Vibrio maritimus TaxID=990268 RepID=UPI001F2AC667|nr:DUF6392 family protein [Vibrio maritimus]
MIEVSRLISMMGATPEKIIEVGLLKANQKPKPRFSGDDELVLDMVREGCFLSFNRKNKCLQRISLTLLNEDKPNYRFPNELPKPLRQEMTKEYVYECMGSPYESKSAAVVMGDIIGGVDHYLMRRDVFGELSQLVYYSPNEKFVESISYMYTKDVSWGELR